MKYLKYIGGVLALCLIGYSASLNGLFASDLGQTDIEKIILASLGITSDLFKALCLFFIARAVMKKRWSQMLAGVLFMVVAVGVSFASSYGFMHTKLMAEYNKKQAIVQKSEEAKLALAKLEGLQVAAIAERKAAVKANTDFFPTLVKRACQCPKTKAADLKAYEAELKAKSNMANNIERLDKLIDKRTFEIATKSKDIKSSKPARIENLQAMFGGDVKELAVLFALFFALFVETASSLALYAAFGPRQKEQASNLAQNGLKDYLATLPHMGNVVALRGEKKSKDEEIPAHSDLIKQFFTENDIDGQAQDVLQQYHNWAYEAGAIEPASMQYFSKQIDKSFALRRVRNWKVFYQSAHLVQLDDDEEKQEARAGFAREGNIKRAA